MNPSYPNPSPPFSIRRGHDASCMDEENLVATLITPDGQGIDSKVAALNELLTRAKKMKMKMLIAGALVFIGAHYTFLILAHSYVSK